MSPSLPGLDYAARDHPGVSGRQRGELAQLYPCQVPTTARTAAGLTVGEMTVTPTRSRSAAPHGACDLESLMG
jgi:hypothetical protein